MYVSLNIQKFIDQKTVFFIFSKNRFHQCEMIVHIKETDDDEFNNKSSFGCPEGKRIYDGNGRLPQYLRLHGKSVTTQVFTKSI